VYLILLRSTILDAGRGTKTAIRAIKVVNSQNLTIAIDTFITEPYLSLSPQMLMSSHTANIFDQLTHKVIGVVGVDFNMKAFSI
jgi:hypothetical protein